MPARVCMRTCVWFMCICMNVRVYTVSCGLCACAGIVRALSLTSASAQMLHWVWPTMGLKEVPVEDLTSIPEQQQLNRDDPLCYHGKVLTHAPMYTYKCTRMRATAEQQADAITDRTHAHANTNSCTFETRMYFFSANRMGFLFFAHHTYTAFFTCARASPFQYAHFLICLKVPARCGMAW